jgi:conjugal transfer pilus assembly protein TraB
MSAAGGTWDSLSPRVRRWLALGAGALVIAALALLIATAPAERGRAPAERGRTLSNLLTDVDPRDLGIDGLGRRLSALEGDLRRLSEGLEQLGVDVADGAGAEARLLQRLRREREAERATLERQLARLRAELAARDGGRPASAAGAGAPPAPPAPPGSPFEPPAAPAAAPAEPPPLDRLFDPPASRPGPGRPPAAAAPALTIRHVADDDTGAAPGDEATETAEVRIPAGSILQGVLLSGMDAPTGRAARQDPYPALLRLKHAAILPNRFRADIRECFLLVGGYGDLGSERVYLRAETINCVRRDGRTLEVAVDGYAVGEDGKVGVRGRLVNKQGQVIGRAMQVSFLEGFSRLFSTVPVASVATGGAAVPYQQVFSAESLQGAAIAGSGKALDRLAEYYLDLADNIFPVLEVDAGRGVEVILNRGVGLKLQ